MRTATSGLSERSNGGSGFLTQNGSWHTPVFSGEFVKQGQKFPWTWRKRAFEVTTGKENTLQLSYYANETRKGSLQLGRVRLPSDDGQALACGVVFESLDGRRQLLARAPSEEERDRWMSKSTELLTAAAAGA